MTGKEAALKRLHKTNKRLVKHIYKYISKLKNIKPTIWNMQMSRAVFDVQNIQMFSPCIATRGPPGYKSSLNIQYLEGNQISCFQPAK